MEAGRVPTPAMRRLRAVLLVLVALAPSVAAQQPHRDFSRAQLDDEMLDRVARLVISQWTDALERSLALEHAPARQRAQDASNLTEAMVDASRVDAASSTSRPRLLPRAEAAEGLTENLTRLVADWATWKELEAAGFHTGGQVLRGRLLVSALHAHVEGGLEGVAAHERLGYDAEALREALLRFIAVLEALPPLLLPPELGSESGLYLEAVPAKATLRERVLLRGALLDRDPVGRPIRLEVDGAPWAEVVTDGRGTFFLSRPVEGLAIGPHSALARATAHDGQPLVSNEARFEVVPIPTRLVLTLPATRFPLDATFDLGARLVDDKGAPVPGNVDVRIDGGPATVLPLDARGAGRLPLVADALGLGSHVARATFAGDGIHAPAEAEIDFIVVEATILEEHPFAARLARILLPWVLLLAILALHVSLLTYLRARRSRLLHPVAAAGPAATALAFHLLTRSPTLTLVGGVAAAAASATIVLARKRAAPDAPDPASAAGAAPASPVEPAAAPAEAGPAAGASDPLHELLALYHVLLRRLAAEGVQPGPMTHREVAEALRARRVPEEPVRALTRALERALYAGRPPTLEEMPPLRAAAATVEATA